MNNRINVTHFSETGIKASLLGVPSIIINPLGKKVFHDLLQSKRAFYAEGKVEFDRVVFETLSIDKQLNTQSENEVLSLKKFNNLLDQ